MTEFIIVNYNREEGQSLSKVLSVGPGLALMYSPAKPTDDTTHS